MIIKCNTATLRLFVFAFLLAYVSIGAVSQCIPAGERCKVHVGGCCVGQCIPSDEGSPVGLCDEEKKRSISLQKVCGPCLCSIPYEQVIVTGLLKINDSTMYDRNGEDTDVERDPAIATIRISIDPINHCLRKCRCTCSEAEYERECLVINTYLFFYKTNFQCLLGETTHHIGVGWMRWTPFFCRDRKPQRCFSSGFLK